MNSLAIRPKGWTSLFNELKLKKDKTKEFFFFNVAFIFVVEIIKFSNVRRSVFLFNFFFNCFDFNTVRKKNNLFNFIPKKWI